MYRRKFLAQQITICALLFPGCVINREEGSIFQLEMSPEECSEDFLNFDAYGVNEREDTILTTAIEEDYYEERWVSWNDVPNRDKISDPFKSLIGEILGHTGRIKQNPPSIPIGISCKYQGSCYKCEIYRDSAE